MSCLWTKDFILTKLSELQDALDGGITRTELDTGQSKQSVSRSIRQIQHSLQIWEERLMRCYPAEYAKYGKSPSVTVNVRRRRR